MLSADSATIANCFSLYRQINAHLIQIKSGLQRQINPETAAQARSRLLKRLCII